MTVASSVDTIDVIFGNIGSPLLKLHNIIFLIVEVESVRSIKWKDASICESL